MANPRMLTGPLDGVGYRAVTFKIDGSTITYDATQSLGSAVAGRAVGLVAGTQNTVELVDAGDTVLGRLDHVEPDGGCAVQIEGECKLPQGNAVDVVRGQPIMGALGASSARGYIGPVSADVAGATAGKHTVLDDATSTAISVYLSQ